ncbi:hypothetical protein TNCV_2996411 [Trichonephila clavipes]|nr:hypothetical protein TNCV_2996411 [Trichonephila clavipes]
MYLEASRRDTDLIVIHRITRKPGDKVWSALTFDSCPSLVVMRDTLTTRRFCTDVLGPSLILKCSRSTGGSTRHFGVTTRRSAVSNYIPKYSRMSDSKQTKFSRDSNYEN